MASTSLFRCFSFLIPMLLMIFIDPSHQSRELLENDDPKVDVSLYYEALCPGCQGYIANVLGDLYEHETDLTAIVNLHLVPYGNALISKNGTVQCQHGPDECYFNTVEACALSMWPLEKSFPFIRCVEESIQKEDDGDDLTSPWKSCCGKLKLDSDELGDFCFKSGHGVELIRENANETESLSPPHTFVPWVTVNCRALGFDFYNLKQYICEAYKGPRKIEACSAHVSSTSSTQEVCHSTVEMVSP